MTTEEPSVRKHPLAHCEVCPLLDRPYVPSDLKDNATLAIVGEAPAQEETVAGRPFVGQSGQILWSVLTQVGISRKNVSVLNACSCRGRDNKVTPEAMDACRPRLLGELKEVKPQLVVALGNTALQSIMDDKKLKITNERGTFGGLRDALGVKVWASIHPASFLYSAGAFPDFTKDMAHIPDILDGRFGAGTTIDEDVPPRVLYTTAELRAFIEELRALPETVDITADDETTGFDYTDDRLLCISFSTDGETATVLAEELMLELDLLREIFALPNFKWSYHNAKFDAQFQRAKLGVDTPVHDDTMMMSYALDERNTKGLHRLKTLAREHEGASDYEKVLDQYRTPKESFDVIPRDVLYHYAGLDAIYTRRLKDTLLGFMDDDLKRYYYDVLIPAVRFFLDVELNGMILDREKLGQLNVEMIDKLGGIEQQLFDITEEEFNPRSPQQVATMMYGKLRLPVVPRLGRSTNAEVLETIQHPFTAIMLEHRKWTKLYGAYVKNIDKNIWADGRVHPDYRIHGAVSRTSCSEPNVQNIPRGPMIRNIFTAPEGYDFVNADFSQHEFRMLAHYSKDPWLQEVYRMGRSLHREAAIELYGEDYTYEEYTMTKNYNFGVVYKRGAYSVSLQTGETVAQAQGRINAFFARMPQAAEYLQNEQRMVMEGQDLITDLGRHRRFGLITRGNAEDVQKQAVNFKLQATGSDTCLMAAAAVQQSKQFAPDEVIPVGFIHDSVLYYVKKDVREQVLPEIEKIMSKVPEEALHADIPFVVESKWGDSWGASEEE